METYEELVQRWSIPFENLEKAIKQHTITITTGNGGIAFLKNAIDEYNRELANTPNTSKNCTLKLKNKKIIEK